MSYTNAQQAEPRPTGPREPVNPYLVTLGVVAGLAIGIGLVLFLAARDSYTSDVAPVGGALMGLGFLLGAAWCGTAALVWQIRRTPR